MLALALIVALIIPPPEVPVILAELDSEQWTAREAARERINTSLLIWSIPLSLTAEQRVHITRWGNAKSWGIWYDLFPEWLVSVWRIREQGAPDVDPSFPWWAKP